MSNQIDNTRKVSDILLSLEDKIVLLIKTISNNDLNNKLILDRLNQLVKISSIQNNVAVTVESKIPEPKIESLPAVEISQQPYKPRKQPLSLDKKDTNKIPVSQRVKDNNDKDLFMADVIITNLNTGESFSKIKTNAVGTWQTYLNVGKYSVHISKNFGADPSNKIEYFQEIEVVSGSKSLQLPAIVINRSK